MKVSVVLCTYNRCESLRKALGSVAASRLPSFIQWEVIVVDNNSRDRTREVAQEFCRLHPGRFRYIFEPRQGKSYALNAAIEQAAGDVLAFMDDDVTVEAMWLQTLTGGLFRGGWAGAGGRILPERSFSPPRWLLPGQRYALAPLAMFDAGPNPGELTEPPVGTNMAFQKRMFQKYGGFRTDLGPCPGSEIRNEDTEFGRRLLAAGERLRYEPSAIVYHSVSEKRLNKRYFLQWWFDKARADTREAGISACVRWYAAGIPLVLFRRLTVWMLRWMLDPHPGRRFSKKLKVWSVAGQILETRRLKRSQVTMRLGVNQHHSA